MINGLMVNTTDTEDICIDIHINGTCSSGYSMTYGGLEDILRTYYECLEESFDKYGWNEETYADYSAGYVPVASLKLVRWGR